MSRSSAEFVREEPPSQPFDVIGLVAGVLFAFVGLAYLIGGHDTLSGHSSLVLPTVVVLVGVAGVAGSGLVRRSWFARTPQPAPAGDPTHATSSTDDLPRVEPDPGDAHGSQAAPSNQVDGTGLDDPYTQVGDISRDDPPTEVDGTGLDDPYTQVGDISRDDPPTEVDDTSGDEPRG